MNFGILKENAYVTLSKAISNKDSNGKKFFKEFVNTIQKNKLLKEEFFIFHHLMNETFSDRQLAEQFVVENTVLLRQFNKKLKPLHGKLMEIFKKYNINIDTQVSHQGLYEAIHLLGSLNSYDKNANNIKQMMTAKKTLVEHVMLDKPKKSKVIKESVNSKLLTTMLVKKYNTKYGALTEEEKKLVKVTIKGTETEKENLFESIRQDALMKIGSNLHGKDISESVHRKLEEVKGKLNEMEFNIGNFNEDIIKLHTLSKSLI